MAIMITILPLSCDLSSSLTYPIDQIDKTILHNNLQYKTSEEGEILDFLYNFLTSENSEIISNIQEYTISNLSLASGENIIAITGRYQLDEKDFNFTIPLSELHTKTDVSHQVNWYVPDGCVMSCSADIGCNSCHHVIDVPCRDHRCTCTGVEISGSGCTAQIIYNQN